MPGVATGVVLNLPTLSLLVVFSPQRGVRFWLGGRNVLRKRDQYRAAVNPGAVQIGEDPEPVTMVRQGVSVRRWRHFAKRVVWRGPKAASH